MRPVSIANHGSLVSAVLTYSGTGDRDTKSETDPQGSSLESQDVMAMSPVETGFTHSTPGVLNNEKGET